jgi:hypothetical protein
MALFWDVVPFNVTDNDRRVKEAYCLHTSISIITIIIVITFNERHGRLFKVPASYSGSPEFKSRPEDGLS